MRDIRVGRALENDVIVLFTEGEEDALLGASAFMDGHRWARDVSAPGFGRRRLTRSLIARLADVSAEIAVALNHVAAPHQGYEIDKIQVRKGAWHPPAVIHGRLRPGLFDCCAA